MPWSAAGYWRPSPDAVHGRGRQDRQAGVVWRQQQSKLAFEAAVLAGALALAFAHSKWRWASVPVVSASEG